MASLRFIRPSTTNEVGRVIERFGRLFVEGAKRNLVQSGANATGSLSQSIAFKVTIMGQSLRFQVFANDYWVFVDRGRGATKRGGGGKVRKALTGAGGWIAAKGLNVVGIVKKITGRTVSTKEANKILGFLIARKIHEKGFKGNRFMSKVINEQSLQRLRKDLSKALKRDVELEINDIREFVS